MSTRGLRAHKKRRSPRWNAGSIEPDRTTTIGDDDAVNTLRPFHFAWISSMLRRLAGVNIPS